MDLIERAKALDFEMEIEAPPDLIQAIMDGMTIYMDYIKQIPAAEVVTCEECTVPHNSYTGCPKLGGHVTERDFFCAYGRRGKADES